MKGSPIVISDMLTAIRKCRTMSRLKGHEQHDAHEFLQEFLDSLGKHCRIYTKHLNQLRFEASSSTFESALNDNSILLSSVDMGTTYLHFLFFTLNPLRDTKRMVAKL
jgi:hypothetical protein